MSGVARQPWDVKRGKKWELDVKKADGDMYE